MMKTILCYGDSNTYGYDPGDLMGLRYPPDQIWTGLLQQRLGDEWTVLNRGMNGRQLPFLEYEGKDVLDMLTGLGKEDLFLIMLGTNDLLLDPLPRAAKAVTKMEKLLKFVTENKEKGLVTCNVTLIIPVLIGKTLDRSGDYHRESLVMAAAFMVLAEKYGIRAVDASGWGVELSYDQVHFSLKGHRIFAERLAEELLK